MKYHEAYTALRDLMAQLHFSVPSAHRVCRDANLDILKIAFGTGAVARWATIPDKAGRQATIADIGGVMGSPNESRL